MTPPPVCYDPQDRPRCGQTSGGVKQKGYILIELLVAATLLSFAGGSLYSGFSQAVKIERKIRTEDALYDPVKIFWMKAEKDLRNAVSLRGYRFSGKQDEMIFPLLGEAERLSEIRYFIKDADLLRAEEVLPNKFVKGSQAIGILLKGVESVGFEYAYLDEEERLEFKPIWMEEPYFGIPKAIQITVKMKNSEKVFSRLISVPQGRWGHVAIEEGNAHE